MWSDSMDGGGPFDVRFVQQAARRFQSSSYQSSSWHETLHWYNRAWRYPLGSMTVEVITVIGFEKVCRLAGWLKRPSNSPYLDTVIDKMYGSAAVIVLEIGKEFRVIGLNQLESAAVLASGGVASLLSLKLAGRSVKNLLREVCS